MENKNFKILCLDGGGSKGMYSLGVLSELEKSLGVPISNKFNLIYGTSTGAIIAAMLAVGMPVSEIKQHYLQMIPGIMGSYGSKARTRKLRSFGEKIFGDQGFEAFKTDVGIVSMNYDTEKPLIFKTNVERASNGTSSFVAGFGVTILDAIEASSAACPIFCKKVLKTTNKEDITAIDGGFIANNPTLFALIDAKHQLGMKDDKIKLLSIGVGNYNEKSISFMHKIFSFFEMGKLFSKILVASSNTTEVETKLLFPHIPMVRINDSFNKPEHGTNMLETKAGKLRTMFQLGIYSYAEKELDVRKLLDL
jgi:patatin-like phospholipase/acyl hydrolase